MKKLLEEAFKLFWIPLIMAIVSYIFFTIKDITLGIIVLVALSGAYALIRLYVVHKKWWLLVILVVVLGVSVGAYFFKAPTISLNINGEKITSAETNISGGTVNVSPAPSNGLYTKGTVVTLTATAGGGRDWKSWTGTDNNDANPTTIKMDNAKQIRVNFDTRFSLIINNQMVIGSFLSFPEGDISVNPAPDNDGKYTSGTTVNLSVRSNTGYDWTSWSGTASDGTNPTTVIMAGGNKNVTVNFEGRFALSIDDHLVIGPVITLNEGTVTVSPAPGDDDKFAYGTKITLTATPDTGYGWKTWTGTGNDAVNPATITINSEKHVNVSFEERYLVMVNNQVMNNATLALTGGTVSADPAPGADTRFTKNAIAKLTAAPDSGYRFDKWSGDVSDKVTSISIVMDGNKHITADFIKTYTLTASSNNTDGGSVSPTSGIYDTGAEITIKATPKDGYRFNKWGGDASGNATSVKITFDADKSVTADFIKVYTLAVTSNPVDGGTVSVSGGTYDTGTKVTLTATAATGYKFDSWEGDATGTDATIEITMSGNKNITAKFVLIPTSGGY